MSSAKERMVKYRAKRKQNDERSIRLCYKRTEIIEKQRNQQKYELSSDEMLF